jgi:hypothetical protein
MSESSPVAGTFRLDGMLQASLPPNRPVAGDMEAWTASAKASGLHFHLSIDGSNFSIVADPAVEKTSKLAKPDLETLLVDALDALLSFLPAPARPQAFSTIRSEEFRPGAAVQTLYTVGPDGAVASEQRTVDIDTEEAPPEITPASLQRAALPALVVLLVALLVSSFFIDYRKLFTEARDRVVPLAKEEVTVDHSALGKFIEVELAGVDNKRNALIFKLKRGPEWDRAFSSPPAESTTDWPAFMTQLAIHQRRLRIELFDKDGKTLSSGEMNLEALHQKETAEIAVYAKLRERLAKVVIRP